MSREINNQHLTDPDSSQTGAGRVLALDLGTERVGVAVSDELRITVRPLKAIPRTNWKQLLIRVRQLLHDFDANTLVIGLPLSLDGSHGSAALEAMRITENFKRSLEIPIYLQDERLSSQASEAELRAAGYKERKLRDAIDSASAAMILRDFITQQHFLSHSSNPEESF